MSEQECPSAGTLFCASCGELPPHEGREVVAHLHGCASCRDALAGMVGTLAVVGAYYANEVSPEERRRETARFKAVLHARRQAGIHGRSGGRLVQWLPAAAVVFVILTGAMLTRASVVVHADQVLQHALLRGRPHTLSKDSWFRIDVRPVVENGRTRVASVSTVRQISEMGGTASRPAWSRWLPGEVVTGLEQYNVDWHEPLSVGAFCAWRARLTQKRDVVIRRGNTVIVTTRPVEDALREVELVIDRESYQAVRMSWTFAGIGRLEIARSAAPPSSATEARAAVAAAAAGTKHFGAAALMDAELEARLALRTAGVDLSGVRVSNTGTSVHVVGTLPSQGERRSLEARLRGLPSVEFRVRHHRPARATRLTVGPRVGERVDRMFAGTDEHERFVPTLRDLAVRVRERVNVLNSLEQRYSDDDVEQLEPATRAKLERLLNLHVKGLNEDLIALETRLAALAGESAPGRAVHVRVVPGDWRRRVRAARAPAHELAGSIEALVMSDETESQGSSAFSALRSVWDSINKQ